MPLHPVCVRSDSFIHLGTGNWWGAAKVPKQILEGTDKRLEVKEKELFLNFVRKILRWKPEERSSAKELLDDPWLS